VVLPEGVSSDSAFEGLDGQEAEPGPDLDQHQLLDVILLRELFLLLVHYLVVPEPNPTVEVGEGEDMVDEGFGLGVVLGGVEGMHQQLLHQLQVVFLLK